MGSKSTKTQGDTTIKNDQKLPKSWPRNVLKVGNFKKNVFEFSRQNQSRILKS